MSEFFSDSRDQNGFETEYLTALDIHQRLHADGSKRLRADILSGRVAMREGDTFPQEVAAVLRKED